MRIGVFSGDVHGRGAPATVLADAKEAADDGLSSFWLPNIFGIDALMMQTAVAAAVPEIELGVAVMPTYPRHPLALAQQAMTASVLSEGRISLGVGPSHPMIVENMFGMSYEHPIKHMREYIEALAELITEGRTMYRGETLSAAGQITIEGYEPMPLLLSALGPLMLELAGSKTDGTVTWMTGARTLASHIVPAVTDAAERAGRTAPRVVAGAPVCVTDDPDGAAERAGSIFATYGGLPAYRAMLDREGVSGPADLALVGDEDRVGAGIAEFADAGVTDFCAVMYGDDEERARTRGLLGNTA